MFFVRHNNGSVWLDALGPPWPKHSCFDDSFYSRRMRTMLADEVRENPRPVFGVVLETVVIEPRRQGRIVVRCSDGTTIDAVFNTSEDLATYVGTLVVIERRGDGSVVSLRRV